MAYEPTFTPPKTVNPPSITPQVSHEPPPEIAKMEFKLDPTISTESDPTRVTVEDKSGISKPVETAKPVEQAEEKKETPERGPDGKFLPKEKKEEVVEEKKEEPNAILKPPASEKKEAAKGEEKVKLFVPPGKEEKKARDYSGFTPEEQTHLKQMSNEAFTFTSNLIKQLASLKDASFLQHPDAYTLSPEYRETQTAIQFAVKEGNYWRDALANVKKGEAITPITGWDDKGNPVLGAEIQPNEQVEEAVRAAMQNCFAVAQQKQGSLNQVQKTFQDRVKSDLQMIQSERARRFGWVSDPKILDYTIQVDGIGEMTVGQIRNSFIDLFPPYLRNNPGTETAADLFVALRIQAAELAQALNGKQTEAIKKEEVARAEPSSETKPAKQVEPVGKVREFSLAGLPS